MGTGTRHPHPHLSGAPHTIVVGLTGVFNLQDPFARGVLVPGMGRHESPVIKPICRVVVWPGGAGCIQLSEASGGCQPGNTEPTTHGPNTLPPVQHPPHHWVRNASWLWLPVVLNQKILEMCEGTAHGKAHKCGIRWVESENPAKWDSPIGQTIPPTTPISPLRVFGDHQGCMSE